MVDPKDDNGNGNGDQDDAQGSNDIARADDDTIIAWQPDSEPDPHQDN